MIDTIPYTYLIGWKDLNKYYYGVRYALGCNPKDLMVDYMTSSKYVKIFVEEHGLPDIIQIRKIFLCEKDARDWEHKVLRRMKVIKRSDFLNHTDNKGISAEAAYKGVLTSKIKAALGTHPNKGRKRPKVSDMNRLKVGSKNPMFGKVGPMKGRLGKDNPNFGKPKTPEQINSLNKLIECTHCKVVANIGNIQRWHGNNCKYKKKG